MCRWIDASFVMYASVRENFPRKPTHAALRQLDSLYGSRQQIALPTERRDAVTRELTAVLPDRPPVSLYLVLYDW